MSPPILLLVLLFVAVAVVGGFVGVRQLDLASSAQIHLTTARDDLDELLRTQLAEEIGLRGYVATGQRYFLEPDGSPTESFDARAATLERELRDARLTDQIATIDDLRQTNHLWEQNVAKPLLANAGRKDALAKETYGKILSDRIRLDAANLRDALRAAGTEVEISLRRRINATVAFSVGTITLVAIAALWLGLSRNRALERLVRERSLVTALQQTLRVEGEQLPRTAVGWAYASATKEALVGGDLIDTWRASGDRGWFLIADASGKGIDAARHSAFVQYAMRTLTAGDDDPATIVASFNRLFLDTFADPCIFVVLFLGTFDAATGVMRYASAGHSGAFVRRATGVEQLPPTGSIVGVDRSEVWSTNALQLATGETIVLATDGLTESRDAAGELLGDEGVMALLREAPNDAQIICERLVREVARRSRGEVQDDLAILALRVTAAGETVAGVPFSTMGV